MSEKVLTVGELRRHLAAFRDSDEVELPGGLTFSRVERLDDSSCLIEVDEILGYLTDAFKKRNPHVKAVFCSPHGELDETGILQKMPDISVR